jgi:hypothetical protein
MEQARLDFRRLVAAATPADLRRPSAGTRWTYQQLLFHMLFGYLIIRALLVLVRVFGLLPDAASKAFARLLDSARRPFDLINYLGSCATTWDPFFHRLHDPGRHLPLPHPALPLPPAPAHPQPST